MELIERLNAKAVQQFKEKVIKELEKEGDSVKHAGYEYDDGLLDGIYRSIQSSGKIRVA